MKRIINKKEDIILFEDVIEDNLIIVKDNKSKNIIGVVSKEEKGWVIKFGSSSDKLVSFDKTLLELITNYKKHGFDFYV